MSFPFLVRDAVQAGSLRSQARLSMLHRRLSTLECGLLDHLKQPLIRAVVKAIFIRMRFWSRSSARRGNSAIGNRKSSRGDGNARVQCP